MSENYDFFFGAGKPQLNNEFRILSNKDKSDKEYEYLIFTDSKGNCEENFYSWVDQLTDKLKINNVSFLLITRPKEMTIFFSLINFLNNNNDIKFKYLITNIGFVDTTPKKREFINDIFDQNPFNNKLTKTPLCNYLLNSGEVSTLYTVNYDSVTFKIAEILSKRFNEIHLIGTFEFSKNIKIERKRPDEFYDQLKLANKLLLKIQSYSENINYIDVRPNISVQEDESDISFDAVHFTQSGHDLVMSICLNHIVLIS